MGAGPQRYKGRFKSGFAGFVIALGGFEFRQDLEAGGAKEMAGGDDIGFGGCDAALVAVADRDGDGEAEVEAVEADGAFVTEALFGIGESVGLLEVGVSFLLVLEGLGDVKFGA